MKKILTILFLLVSITSNVTFADEFKIINRDSKKVELIIKSNFEGSEAYGKVILFRNKNVYFVETVELDGEVRVVNELHQFEQGSKIHKLYQEIFSNGTF